MNYEEIRLEIERYPQGLAQEFQAAWPIVSEVLEPEQATQWAQFGLEMAASTVRSWESAARYFHASPKVVRFMSFDDLSYWAREGIALCQPSPSLAAAYFDSTPSILPVVSPVHLPDWAKMGSRLYKGTWKSSALACSFYESSLALLESMTLAEMEEFAAFLDVISRYSCDLASECLQLGIHAFPQIGNQKGAFLSLAAVVAGASWRQVKGLFEVVGKALPKVRSDQHQKFMGLVGKLVDNGNRNVPLAMLDMAEALALIDFEAHPVVLELAESLLDFSPDAACEFVKSCPRVLASISISQLHRWFGEGINLLEQNTDGGLAYFKVESAHSEKVLDSLSANVEYDRVKGLMERYCCALAGEDIRLATSEELTNKNIGWVSHNQPSTEGTTVYVPAIVDRYPIKQDNFAWYKVVVTHQAGHIEFGSFGFEFEKPSLLFDNLRLATPAGTISVNRPVDGGTNGDSQQVIESVTDMQRFFDLFQDRKLALDIFTAVEDNRLDAQVKREYPGIKAAYLNVQHDSLDLRPDIKTLPAREALVELLVRLSLHPKENIPVPADYMAIARQMALIASRVVDPKAAVEDSAEAALRIYALLMKVPNDSVEEDKWDSFDSSENIPGDSESGIEELARQLMNGVLQPPDDREDYESAEQVDFRGDFKPEMVQLLARLRKQHPGKNIDIPADQIPQELLEELLKNSAELDLDDAEEGQQEQAAKLVKSMLKEAARPPETKDYKPGPLVHVDEEGGALDPSEPQSFAYDEWDFRAGDYKPRWCIVQQRNMPEGDQDYYSDTLKSYGAIADQIKRQFEFIAPEMLRKVNHLESGEDLNIDDVIESIVDVRTGAGPSEKLFWRRNKIQRDVSVVFLLDTSASTAEAIDEGKKGIGDWDAPDDPLEYMAWLKNRRIEGMRRSFKRIIDVEKEAIVLLTHALEAIGDTYGVYGFSGYGRENVEFYTVKDLNERFSDRVEKRIDRVAPLHATRMGPAIRHATTKLMAQDARTRVLFLISDGRPQDRGYSREGVEKEYAVRDTKMALDEAKSKDITAFCLTVDRNGHDYLGTMCQDIGYEVLDDVSTLPQRLLYLYRRLTT